MSRISQVEHCFLKAPQLLPCPRFFHGLNQAWILTTSHDGSHHRSDHASYYAVYRPITIGLGGKGTGECINADAYSYTNKMYMYIYRIYIYMYIHTAYLNDLSGEKNTRCYMSHGRHQHFAVDYLWSFSSQPPQFNTTCSPVAMRLCAHLHKLLRLQRWMDWSKGSSPVAQLFRWLVPVLEEIRESQQFTQVKDIHLFIWKALKILEIWSGFTLGHPETGV